jgi:hypothetical protein
MLQVFLFKSACRNWNMVKEKMHNS